VIVVWYNIYSANNSSRVEQLSDTGCLETLNVSDALWLTYCVFAPQVKVFEQRDNKK